MLGKRRAASRPSRHYFHLCCANFLAHWLLYYALLFVKSLWLVVWLAFLKPIQTKDVIAYQVLSNTKNH